MFKISCWKTISPVTIIGLIIVYETSQDKTSVWMRSKCIMRTCIWLQGEHFISTYRFSQLTFSHLFRIFLYYPFDIWHTNLKKMFLFNIWIFWYSYTSKFNNSIYWLWEQLYIESLFSPETGTNKSYCFPFKYWHIMCFISNCLDLQIQFHC